ncbi:cytochrome P450 [Backusella circina FSU 941]|nr:cytochrome P450 [Backusella circina FSU 941]
MMFAHNRFIDWCNQKFGETYRISMFGETIYVASGKAGEESMKANREDFSINEGTSVDLLHLDFLHEKAILDIGQDIHPSIAKDLLSSAKMPRYLPSVLEGFAKAKKDMISETGPTLVSNPSVFFQNFVAYMSVPTLIGDEFKDNIDIIQSFAACTGDAVKNTPLYMLFPKFMHPMFKVFLSDAKRHTDLMKKYVEPFVQKYRDDPTFGNKDSFLREVSLFEHNGELLSAQQAAQSILLVAFASVHTTSSNTSIALYWLLARPELLQKFLQEVEHVFPNNAPITYEGLQEMPFLNNLLKETLRQSISSLSSRKKAGRDYTFHNGYQMPKGGIVQVASRALNLGLNVNRFGVDAMDPEMSLNKPITTPARDFVSFGAGKHLCPGRFFATQEIKIMLIELFRNYEIKTASGKRPEPYTDLFGMAARNCEDPLIFTPRVAH